MSKQEAQRAPEEEGSNYKIDSKKEFISYDGDIVSFENCHYMDLYETYVTHSRAVQGTVGLVMDAAASKSFEPRSYPFAALMSEMAHRLGLMEDLVDAMLGREQLRKDEAA